MNTLKNTNFVDDCECCSYPVDVLPQVLEGRPIYVDCYGNLAPLTKAGQQLVLNFYAFKENRLPFCVKVIQHALHHHSHLQHLLLRLERGVGPILQRGKKLTESH